MKLLPNRILVWREIRDGERVYRFEGEAAVGKLFNGLVHIERYGVPNGTQQTTERPLSFVIDLLVVAA
jgi:hypothetical protein